MEGMWGARAALQEAENRGPSELSNKPAEKAAPAEPKPGGAGSILASLGAIKKLPGAGLLGKAKKPDPAQPEKRTDDKFENPDLKKWYNEEIATKYQENINKPPKKKYVPPPSFGKRIKTADTIRRSPRDFLRIGKVQKETEEPMTEAQHNHRDRSYIIQKLNKSVQMLRGEEDKKKVVRGDYLNMYKSSASLKTDDKKAGFSSQADAASPQKQKKEAKYLGSRGKKKEPDEPASETYLTGATKEKPIFVGHEVTSPKSAGGAALGS